MLGRLGKETPKVIKRDGQDEILLQGFVRIASKHESIIADHDDQQGIFCKKLERRQRSNSPFGGPIPFPYFSMKWVALVTCDIFSVL